MFCPNLSFTAENKKILHKIRLQSYFKLNIMNEMFDFLKCYGFITQNELGKKKF